ncbi:MAG: glycosyltransferase family 4 protein [Planctomycetota bacterium]|uniref:glycosyltransferase family 4 protein n=1 Tax=Brevundimonas sp. TaxID=1871086 RepID=UPI00262D7478|nr:glycosyltransferase family 4 protein [Brevundimonas sp.]MDQ7780786.1 glycosyltransferase family 4 protein [Planctomycetota bacterium]
MIIHFTTVHPRDDSRIRSKELASLAAAFSGNVALYVQDGLGDEIDPDHGYRVVDTGPRLRRLPRMFLGGWRMFRAVAGARPRVAHFHDPELLPWAILLGLFGIKVVYDVHEDMPRQVRHNPGLPPVMQRLLPPFVSLAEWIGARLISGLVVPTPVIQDRFPADKTILVRNFPLLDELHAPNPTPMRLRPREFTYIGSISEVRNIFAMVKAVTGVSPPAQLRLAGEFAVAETLQKAMEMPEWASTRFEGWTSRDGVAKVLADGRAGLVILQPVEHEMVTLPIKLFEYMAAGLPVISSDFPVWREIVDSAHCGLMVDPMDIDEIVAAMQWIVDHPDEAEEMGRNGRRAVEDRYSWEREGDTLIAFYRDRLGLGRSRQESAADAATW